MFYRDGLEEIIWEAITIIYALSGGLSVAN